MANISEAVAYSNNFCVQVQQVTMARLKRGSAEIILVVEEIMNMLFHMLVVLLSRNGRVIGVVENYRARRIYYRMADRIPGQIDHLRYLVGFTDEDYFNNLRMNRPTFTRLCYLLQHRGGLEDSRYVTVPEQVACFLTVLAHHTKVRVVKFHFKRSAQTVSKYIHNVLKAVLRLHDTLLVTPEPVDEENNHPRWKWFKGCLGALDGTYIDVTVRESDKPRYRTRKGNVAVNVLAVCGMQMKFVYLLTGWEGSAADSRVLRDAVSRHNGLRVPQGNYYLCDNGYTNGQGFLAPYKSVRYHLDEWSQGRNAPQNFQEFFNMNHSKARNVIERTFGILKKRWAILRSASFYPIKVQNRMIMACALLHNFIRTEMPIDPIEQEADGEATEEQIVEPIEFIDSVENTPAWTNWRDALARGMWDEWRGIA